MGFVPTQKSFNPMLKMDREELLETVEWLERREWQQIEEEKTAKKRETEMGVENKQRFLKLLGFGDCGVKKKHTRRPKATRRAEVNSKRQTILEAINRSSETSIKGIAKETHCHPSTVKSVFDLLRLRGHVPQYEYNNIHPQETCATIDHFMADPAHKYASTADIKRVVPQCSRRFISRRLRGAGLRYRKLKRDRADPIPRRFDEGLMESVIRTAVQAFAKDEETLLFLDEAEFPLNNTSDYCWSRADEVPVYNRRESPKSLHVIALCSQTGFWAVQVHTERINQEAIHYFLTRVLAEIYPTKKLVILLDNAGWHVANLVKRGEMGRLLLHSVPNYWELNLIENSFSKAKAEWRRRRVVATVDEEIQTLVGLFAGRDLSQDFGGYRRHYLRGLKTLLTNFV